MKKLALLAACCAPKGKLRPADTRPYEQVFKALGDATRLEIVELLASASDGELCVCDIETHFDLSQPTISHHLRLLREASLVTSERRGTWVYYALARGTLDMLSDFRALLSK